MAGRAVFPVRAVARLLALLAAAASAPVRAAPPPVEIVEYGEFDSRDGGESDAPDTTRGSIVSVDSYRLLRRTVCIPGEPGIRFGVTARVALAGFSGIQPVRFVIDHPPFDLPDGRRPTREAWPGKLVGQPLYFGWRFDEAYEIVPGRWTVTILLDGQVAARKAFEVLGPGEKCPAEVS